MYLRNMTDKIRVSVKEYVSENFRVYYGHAKYIFFKIKLFRLTCFFNKKICK